MKHDPVTFMNKYAKHAWRCYHTVVEVAAHIDMMVSKLAKQFNTL